jgi:hypothetical protein
MQNARSAHLNPRDYDMSESSTSHRPYLTSGRRRPRPGEKAGLVYSRFNNPNSTCGDAHNSRKGSCKGSRELISVETPGQSYHRRGRP